MQYWLLKSEPGTWSWQEQLACETTPWDGVRSYQAAGFMREMQKGDRAFFYHSGKDRQIVGIVEVTRAAYPDPEAPKFPLVDVGAVRSFLTPVFLGVLKSTPDFAHLKVVRQSRLSVSPIDPESWQKICALGGVSP